VRNRRKSVEQLGSVFKRIRERKKENLPVMVVGTTAELGRLRERVCQDVDSTKRMRVTRSWVSGMLTNYGEFQNFVMRLQGTKEERKTRSEKRWDESQRKGREGFVADPKLKGKEARKAGLPGLIIFRHPNDHGVGRKEASRCGIPTVGVADSDCQYRERLTYPVPGNDESREGLLTLVRRVKGRYLESDERSLDQMSEKTEMGSRSEEKRGVKEGSSFSDGREEEMSEEGEKTEEVNEKKTEPTKERKDTK